MSSIAVIDYGMGNLHSVAKALEHVAPDAEVRVTNDAQRILSADRVLLPGVGAIRDCMGEIKRLQLDTVIREALADKPFLAICIGIQALMERSEENGGVECLGHFRGQAKFFGDPLQDAAGNKLKVPHMGWNQVYQTGSHPLWQGIPDASRFYFVHSYYVEAANQAQIMGRCEYGLQFTVALAQDNVFAVQFHPEKSHTAGLQLLRNFMQWDGTV